MSREPDDNLRSALTATAHEFSGGTALHQLIGDALRGVVARAGRYDAQATPVLKVSPDSSSPVSNSTGTADPCLTEGCGKPRQWKGLCRSCYSQALRAIEVHGSNWDELEAMGLASLDDKPFMALFKTKKGIKS